MTSISHDNAEWYINIITYLRHRPLDLLTRYRKIPITVQRSLHTTIVHALLVALNQVDSQATPFSLIGRGREKRDW